MALQVALLVPLIAGLLGLVGSFRMAKSAGHRAIGRRGGRGVRLAALESVPRPARDRETFRYVVGRLVVLGPCSSWSPRRSSRGAPAGARRRRPGRRPPGPGRSRRSRACPCPRAHRSRCGCARRSSRHRRRSSRPAVRRGPRPSRRPGAGYGRAGSRAGTRDSRPGRPSPARARRRPDAAGPASPPAASYRLPMAAGCQHRRPDPTPPPWRRVFLHATLETPRHDSR